MPYVVASRREVLEHDIYNVLLGFFFSVHGKIARRLRCGHNFLYGTFYSALVCIFYSRLKNEKIDDAT